MLLLLLTTVDFEFQYFFFNEEIEGVLNDRYSDEFPDWHLPDLCRGSKKVRDPGFAESKVWDLDGSWTLHVLFAVGLWKPRTSKLCYVARPWKPRTSKC